MKWALMSYSGTVRGLLAILAAQRAVSPEWPPDDYDDGDECVREFERREAAHMFNSGMWWNDDGSRS